MRAEAGMCSCTYRHVEVHFVISRRPLIIYLASPIEEKVEPSVQLFLKQQHTGTCMYMHTYAQMCVHIHAASGDGDTLSKPCVMVHDQHYVR